MPLCLLAGILSLLSLSRDAAAADLLLNPGFEAEYPTGQSTNWWYYGAVGRAAWAARAGSVAGMGFLAVGNESGGFGQDVPLDPNGGSICRFNISAKAEPNYTVADTRIAIEFWSGAAMRYAVTSVVYSALAAKRGQWVYLTLIHTNADALVDTAKVRCDFSGGDIPGGTLEATCQFDDARFYQIRPYTSTPPTQAKFEPVAGAYLGIVLDRGGTTQEIAEVNTKAGKRHAVYARFLLFEQDPFPWDWVNQVKSACPGAGLHLILEPMVGFTNFFAADWGPGQATYEAALEFVTNCAAVGSPIFLRFAHEANGDWYPWHPQFSERYGIPDNVSNATYIAGYRNFASLVHAHAPNVAMVWAPNQGNGPPPLPFYDDIYPGDPYVDWVGLSVYNGRSYGNGNEVVDFQFRNAIEQGYWQKNDDFYDDTFENFYWTYSDPDNPDGHHKPMMIAETAAAFEPKYELSDEVVIAEFEALDGPSYTVSNMLCRFQNLNSDGWVVTNGTWADGFDDLTIWNWGPWGNLFWSNSSDCVQGTNAAHMGGTPGPGEAYVGGNGRTYDPDWSMNNGMELWAKCDSSANPYPILTVGLRSASPGGTATASRVITAESYGPLRISFSDMTVSPGFNWSNIWDFTLELLTTEPGSRPRDVLVDRWSRGTLTNALYKDQDWWPVGTGCVPWADGGDTHTWSLVSDPHDSYPTNALKISGTDANARRFNGMELYAKRDADARPDSMLGITIRSRAGSADGTASVQRVVTHTNYYAIRIPFDDLVRTPDFTFTNVSALVLESYSTVSNEEPAACQVDAWRLVNLVAEPYRDQDWWPPGTNLTAWQDETDTNGGWSEWTLVEDPLDGSPTNALRMGGRDGNTNFYIGGNGCSLAIAQQDWSGSDGLLVYAKKGEMTGRVQPKCKITLDNDYAETNGNEAVVETKIANTNYYPMVIAFEDFFEDGGFAWTNVKMVKIEYFTGEGGRQPNDLFLDHIARVSLMLTNGADNLKWKHDWCDQLYALSDHTDDSHTNNPYTPHEYPDFVSIFTHFRNIHMINWFHVKKFEDGFTKDLKIVEDGAGEVAYQTYNDRIKDSYFLTNIVTDADGDFMSDDWESLYFGGATNADAQSDSDFDGLSNWQEYLAGSNPRNKDSAFELSAAGVSTRAVTNGFVIEWQSEPNRLYTMDRSTNLNAGFGARVNRIPATPPLNTYTDIVENAGPYFYRLRILP